MSKRLDGLGPGTHRSLRIGEGIELSDIREYTPGDDVRSIDWNVTARTGQPHVRVYEADRQARALMVLDRSGSMSFGTARSTKEFLLRQLVAAVAVLILRNGDRLSGLAFGETPLAGMPMTSGKKAALRLLQMLVETEPAEGRAGRLDLALEEAARLARRRSLIVIASDWLDDANWQEPLSRVAYRHEVVAAEIRDPRESELPRIGPVTFQDPETGRQLEVDTSRPSIQAAFAEAVARQHREREEKIRGAGAHHLIVSTDRDWLGDLIVFLERRKKWRR